MVVSINNVTKRFGAKEVLQNVNLAIPENSIFGFVGANGAGKTTLMKCMLGLLPVTSGTITIAGEAVTFGQTKSNAHVGYLPDVPEFYPYYTAQEYLKLCAVITNMPKRERKQRIEELLELVGLIQTKSPIRTYSRGMKQRLGIAQALLNRPKLLICDEPTSALDPVGRAQILTILQAAKSETTVFFSTHILSDAEQICDRVAMLHEGTIIFEDELTALQQQVDHQFVFTFTTSVNQALSQLSELEHHMYIEEDALIVQLSSENERLQFMRELTDRNLVIQSMHPHTKLLEQVVLEVLK
ncbi:ABC transporter ATP-binding protein [Sporosarcina sp. BI001-red]|uniref:ABC transporter ATP-binding protein n=1 Tax=Sporosarcina sp. BI001-red TaxID=2282866 RepID=UPI000E23A1AC|nr:ABC transporter ATP-binding protein [Sporosarcina sp. BI001-red]REB08513.1 ABC transporter ATP-binding protein [Sporosarcina sp. BI001-red]